MKHIYQQSLKKRRRIPETSQFISTLVVVIIGLTSVVSCQKASPSDVPKMAADTLRAAITERNIPPDKDEIATATTEMAPIESPLDYDTTQWTEIRRKEPAILIDMRYATENNFMEQQIYDCGRCFFRPPVARALVAAQRELMKRGLGFKFFDCYRPAPYQQRLWDAMPDPRYVARPSRGSVHGRGAAGDLTVVNLHTGEELDMGTGFDFFGPEAHSAQTELPDTVLTNRRLLQSVMRRHGFATIRTEWWHFDFRGPRFPLSDWVWNCPPADGE